MNIAIVDDDEKEIEAFSSVIKEYAMAAGVEIGIAAFHSAEEFLENYRRLVYTAIFMDVYMNGMDGVSAASEIFMISSFAFSGTVIRILGFHDIFSSCPKNPRNGMCRLLSTISVPLLESSQRKL